MLRGLSRSTALMVALAAATAVYVAFGLPAINVTGSGSSVRKKQKKSSKKRSIRGLYNEGNTCFLNTTLQALAACPSFIQWVKNLNSAHNSNSLTISAASHILLSINREDSSEDANNTCSTKALVKALHSKGWKLLSQEEDAHEFLNVLCMSIAEDTIKSKAPCGLAVFSEGKFNLEAISKSPFHGYLASQLCCWTCGSKMPVHYDAFECLSVPLPNREDCKNIFTPITLNGLLESFFQPETVTDVNCTKCGQNQDPVKRAFLKKLSLAKMPKCLCIHIQRSQWLSTGHLLKRHDKVAFQTTFNARQFFSDGKTFQLPSEKCQYELCAAIVHMGTADSGHFVTYRRGPSPFSHVWFYVSDADVRLADVEEVQNSCPYMLFYERS